MRAVRRAWTRRMVVRVPRLSVGSCPLSARAGIPAFLWCSTVTAHGPSRCVLERTPLRDETLSGQSCRETVRDWTRVFRRPQSLSVRGRTQTGRGGHCALAGRPSVSRCLLRGRRRIRVGSSTRETQGRRHEQSADSSRHSGTAHGQASSGAAGSRRRGSSPSQGSEREGHSEDSERPSASGSGHHHGSAFGHAGDSARHSASQRGRSARHGQSESAHGRSDSGAAGRHGSSHGQSPDSSGRSGSHHAEASSRGHTDSARGQSRSSTRGRQESRPEHSADSSRHSGTAHGPTSSTSSSSRNQRSNFSEAGDSVSHSGSSRRWSASSHGLSESHSRVGSTVHPEHSAYSSGYTGSSQDPTSSHNQSDSVVQHSRSSRRPKLDSTVSQLGDTSSQSQSGRGHTSSFYETTRSNTTEWQGSVDVPSHPASQVSGYNSGLQSHDSRHHFGNNNSHSVINEKQRHGSGQGWRHGSYGSADYDYGESGFGQSQDGSSSRDYRHAGSRGRSEPGEFIRYNITGSYIHPGTYGHSSDTSKQLGFCQSQKYYYYE
nr:filaggrin-like [Equus caballus]